MSANAHDTGKTLAPLHLRLFALLFDYLLIVSVLNLGEQALLGPGWDLRPVPETAWEPFLPRLFWGATLLLVKDAALGLSPGKWLMGIRVAPAANPAESAGRGALILRNAALVLLPLEAVLVIADAQCRRLGDRWAATVVVTGTDPAPIARRMLAFVAVFLATLLAGFVVAPWNMRRSSAYQEAERAIASDASVAARAGANATLDDAREFSLDLAPGKERARIAFTAAGAAGSARGTLVLEMKPGVRRWILGAMILDEPRVNSTDAPPDPAAKGR